MNDNKISLKERIDAVGLRHHVIAKRLEIHPVQLSYWLNGNRPFPYNKKTELISLLERAEKALQ